MATRQLHYPKIPDSRNCPGGRCIAIEKYDGTNIHFAWDRDFGWHAFGTRRDEFNLTEQGIEQFSLKHAQLAETASVFEESLSAPLDELFRSQQNYTHFHEIAVFAELHGPKSFAGLHKADDNKRLTLFDVRAGDFGRIGPGFYRGNHRVSSRGPGDPGCRSWARSRGKLQCHNMNTRSEHRCI